MDLYGEKKNAIRTVVFLCAIWLVFLIADLIKQDTVFSENENRVLTSKPKLSREAVLDGTYMESYENYLNDQFVSRDNWIMLKTQMDMLMQKKVIRNVYLGEDDYYLEQHLPTDFPADLVEKRLGLLQQLTGVYPQTKVMLVPTADNILTDKLPAFAPYYDQEDLLQKTREAVGKERVIDVFPVLKEHAKEEIYYRTDHHWTTLGAYYGYREFAKAYGLPVRNYQRQEPVAVTEEFLGTLHSKLNLDMKEETIYMFPQTLEKEYRVTYDLMIERDSLYEESYLEGKNKYGYFLDDNHGLVEIERESYSDRTLFIIKDSYANSMIPLLAHHYKKIYVIDLRYFKGNLFQFMQSREEAEKMEVLVLYNCVHFLEEFQYQ